MRSSWTRFCGEKNFSIVKADFAKEKKEEEEKRKTEYLYFYNEICVKRYQREPCNQDYKFRNSSEMTEGTFLEK